MGSTLILGGVRSGKSGRALSLAEKLGESRLFIATAEALDDEMADRIARHKTERGVAWSTVEAPLDIANVLDEHGREHDVVLIDCLTLWLSNLFHAGRDADDETRALLESVAQSSADVIVVSNEVGMGIVPESSLGRSFRDAQGRLNRRVAEAVNRVEFVIAGITLQIKGEALP